MIENRARKSWQATHTYDYDWLGSLLVDHKLGQLKEQVVVECKKTSSLDSINHGKRWQCRDSPYGLAGSHSFDPRRKHH
jgi:hypothetical protein